MSPDPLSAGSRFPLRGLLVICLLLLVVGIASLGQRDVWAPDEPKYALVAKEMIETGQFLLPHVNGAPYPDKPPLLFWSIALVSLLVGGVGQPAAVIPVLLGGLATLIGTARLTWVLSGRGSPRAVLIAVGALAVSYRFMNQSLTGQIDGLLCAFTTWAFVLLVEWDESLRAGKEARRKLVIAWALMAAGTLAKGPVALILPLGGLLLGSWLAGRRPAWRALRSGKAWAAFAGVMALWLGPAAVVALGGGHEDWLHNLLFKQTVVRYANSWHHEQPFWYFLVVPWYDFFPAMLFVPAAVVGLWKHEDENRRRAARSLAGAALFVLVFFSIPTGKRGLYVLPAYPWLASLIGLDLSARLRAGGRRLRPLRAAAASLGALCVAVALFLALRVPDELAERGLDLPWEPIALSVAAAALASLVWTWRPQRLGALLSVGLAFLALYLSLVRIVYPELDQRRSARLFIEEVRSIVGDTTPGAMVDFRAQFGLHAGRLDEAMAGDAEGLARIAERLAGEDAYWVIMKREHRDALMARYPPTAPPPLEALARPVSDDDYLVLANEAALPAKVP